MPSLRSKRSSDMRSNTSRVPAGDMTGEHWRPRGERDSALSQTASSTLMRLQRAITTWEEWQFYGIQPSNNFTQFVMAAVFGRRDCRNGFGTERASCSATASTIGCALPLWPAPEALSDKL